MILDYFNVRKLVVVATVAWVGSFPALGTVCNKNQQYREGCLAAV